jgi:hypothetical protein
MVYVESSRAVSQGNLKKKSKTLAGTPKCMRTRYILTADKNHYSVR